jgi:hypothetical protein
VLMVMVSSSGWNVWVKSGLTPASASLHAIPLAGGEAVSPSPEYFLFIAQKIVGAGQIA